jgi:tRNA A22 N-methylase
MITDVDLGIYDEGEQSDKTLSRGHILQRHKVEYKRLRSKLQELKEQKQKLGKANKDRKKEITKEIKELSEGVY